MEEGGDEEKKKKVFQGSEKNSGSGSLTRIKSFTKGDDDGDDVNKAIDIDSSSELDGDVEKCRDVVDVETGRNVDDDVNKAIDIDSSSCEEEEEEEEKGKRLDLKLDEDVEKCAEEKENGKSSTEEEGSCAEEQKMPEEVNDVSTDEAVQMLMRLWDLARDYEDKQRSIQMVRMRARMRKDRKRCAKEYAPTFARVQRKEEEDENENEGVPAEPVIDHQQVDDRPGPFSTAMRAIKQRENGSVPELDVEWKGAIDPERKRVTPKLEDMSMSLLAKHVEALSSLSGVPDVLRNKLSNVLCDSRRMDYHFMELLTTTGSPTEIRVKDCSWLAEEQFSKIMKGCDTNNLMVLQLDLSGHCLPDYILRATLAKRRNSLPALLSISLRGACRLTDGGIKALVASAPSLWSVNLSACPLLSSTSIEHMADVLGSVLKELYLDDCQNIDMMLSLPALQKFEFLEVLSIADIQTVSDDFVSKFVTLRGQNMKELDFSDCSKLTDNSLKAVGEKCSALQTLHLANLHKLTDSSLGYLANGCQLIQTLKLRGNAFSDEAVAAFLEVSGEPLTEFSLNKVKKVGRHTAISLANRSKNLVSLDLSWCRSLTDSALGIIVDSCKKLKMVKLFGCTQITSKFVNGHSNACVHIVGLQLTPILEHLNFLGHQEAA